MIDHPSYQQIKDYAQFMELNNLGLSEKTWKHCVDTYVDECSKNCYADRVFEKGDELEFGVRGVYVCSGCGYARSPINESFVAVNRDFLKENAE